MILKRLFPNKVRQSVIRLNSGAAPVWREKSLFPWFLPVQTRWKDNDQYLHLNNAVYHAIFDTVINVYLIRNLGLDILSTTTSRGYMITNGCTFHGPAAFPNIYLAGLCVSKLGTSSVRYQLALFPLVEAAQQAGVAFDLVRGHTSQDPVLDAASPTAIVTGEYLHCFVDPITKKSVPISLEWRERLSALSPLG